MLRRTILHLILLLAGVVGFVVCAVMLVMAVRFLELGRMVFYAVLTLVFAELAILSFLRLRKNKQ